MEKIKIFVSTYNKPVDITGSVYVPIQVGKKVSGVDLGYLGDDTGDNISDKNHYYSEQSGVYWVWKNLKEHPEYVGFCHYRKYPTFGVESSITDFQTNADKFNKSYSEKLIYEAIDSADVIAINPFVYGTTLESMYKRCHISDDFDALHETIKECFADYLKSFEDTLCNGRGTLIPYNVYVMKWELFDEYCKFIFGVFSELEKRIDLNKHVGYQSRVFGYMAERLFTVFMRHKCPKIKFVPCSLLMEYFDHPIHNFNTGDNKN